MTTWTRMKCFTGMASILLVAASTLNAQDYDIVAPQEFPQGEPGTIEQLPEEDTPITEDDSTVLVDSLKGIIFVGSPSQVSASGTARKGVIVDGVPMLQNEAFREKAGQYLGKAVTLRRLQEITREVVIFFRKNDRPVVDAIVPEQDIKGGTVQILVLEGHVGKVLAEGNKWFSDKRLTSKVRLNPGDEIRQSILVSDIRWLNTNPFRHVDLVYARGDKLGETDLVLRTRDRFPLRVYAGYQDTGNDTTGDERWFFGVNYGDLWGLDHQFNYQFTGSSDFNMMRAHSASYVAPLPWRHTWTVFGSYAESDADLPAPFNLEGKTWQASTRYEIPLADIGSYIHSLNLGFDFKQSNNNLGFGGTQVFNTTTDVNQFVFAYSGTLPDRLGSTRLGIEVAHSPGGWSDQNKTTRFLATRAFAQADYTYLKFTADRLTRLPADFTWSVKATGQISDENLLSSEQLGLGGYGSVRGYEEREANADEGLILNQELRTPSFSIFAPLFGFPEIQDSIQLLGFWDYALGHNRYLVAGEDPNVIMSSVGPGIRIQFNQYASFRFDYGFQLTDSGQSDGRHNSRAHIGFTLSY